MSKDHTSNLERATLQIFWRIIWDNKPLFLRSLIYLIGVICIYVIVPLFISMTLANLATGSGSITDHIVPLLLVALIGVGCNFYGFKHVLRLQARCQFDLFELTMNALLGRSIGFHTNTISGKLVSNMVDFPAAFGRLVDTAYVSIAPFALLMIVGIVIILSRSLAMGAALLVVTGTTLSLVVRDSRRRSQLRVKRKIAQNNMIAHLSDTIVNAAAVKTFAREHDELAQHKSLSQRLLKLRLRDWTLSVRAGSFRMGTLLILQVAFIAFVAYLLQHDRSILGIGIFAFSYTITLTNRLFEVGAMLLNIDEAFLMASSMTAILRQQTEIVDIPRARALKIEQGTIVLKSVDFAYGDNSRHDLVFKDLSLTIPAGQKIGLVGPSGGGKSTLTRCCALMT